MAYDPRSLDQPFAALKTYDWGGDAAVFAVPIDAAVVAAHGDAAARADLEQRLAALLGAGTSRACKEYACRKLAVIGTAASVPALAALLPDRDHSHMARFALERIDAPAAADALRTALGTLQGDLRIGMISSLASRRDAACVPLVSGLLGADPATAIAAAEALGTIRSPESIQALAAADIMMAKGVGAAVVDARLACAEALLRQGKRTEALAIYKALATAAAGKPAAKSIELAATRGILACLDSTTGS